ncbi:MAG TPA: hypothetical protein VME86_14835 [Acidobacteriaceae bacterium]|nr:hypothetical protein [Acidobacteriaceae bacterium]
MANKERLLTEILPEFSAELAHLLEQGGQPKLAKQIATLRIFEKCNCNDDFCSSFYTRRNPHRPPGRDSRSISLEPKSGLLILDVVGDEIIFVEVLYRDDVRAALKSALGWF